MTNIEERSLKTQLKLHEGIAADNGMIFHYVRNEADNLFSSIIEPVMFESEGETHKSLKVEDIARLRVFLVALKENRLEVMSKMAGYYIGTRDVKEKILSSLKE